MVFIGIAKLKPLKLDSSNQLVVENRHLKWMAPGDQTGTSPSTGAI